MKISQFATYINPLIKQLKKLGGSARPDEVCTAIVDDLQLPDQVLEELIADLRIQFVSKSISERAFELMKKFRSSHGVEINDMLIAATAIEGGVKMISKNQKHYQFLPGLNLLQYPLGEV